MPSLLPPIPDLPAALRELIAQVPRGRVTTPGQLATALGNPVAARWIGHFLLHHEHGSDCTCHRVVRAGGVLGPYPCGGDEKARRLEWDGLRVVEGRVDCDSFGFDDFACDRPLEKLARYQNRIAKKVSLCRRRGTPRFVGGVDVSYAAGNEGVAAYALIEVATGELVWSTTIRRPIRFPYITSYLTFRELPLLVALIEEVRAQKRLAPVVVVDGTGILHPRRAGIACHLGVVARIATIGLTKKLLCGQVDIKGLRPMESRPVLIDEAPIGVAIRPTAGSLRPLFVSPGSGVDLASAARIVGSVLAGKRLPLPVYWADRLSRQCAKTCGSCPTGAIDLE
jgi:deoxyribonuclease V